VSRFGIYRLRGGDGLVCWERTDLEVATPYLLCAPVVRKDVWGAPVPRLQIVCDVEGVGHLVLMTQMEALSAGDLGVVVGSAEARRYEIPQAVDLLVVVFEGASAIYPPYWPERASTGSTLEAKRPKIRIRLQAGMNHVHFWK
jgi:toxin CcdB